MNLPIFNRLADGKFKLPEDGWFHLVPRGEYPHPESGHRQIIDDEALRAMVNRFTQEAAAPNFPGILVDFDHDSYDITKSSVAAGWIKAVQNRENGLWGRIEWSDLGEAALQNGRYRLISPTWLPKDVQVMVEPRDAQGRKMAGGKSIRPLRLDSAGLTNQPNLRGMVPLSNRSPGGDADTTATHDTSMKSIAAQVGLSADASEQSVLDAVKVILNRATTAEGKVATLETEINNLKATNKSLLEAQVDTDLKLYVNRIKPESKEKWKAQLLANRASTIELLAELPEIGGKPPASANQPMHNRANTQNPGANGRDAAESDDAENARKQSAEIETYRLSNRCSYEAARNAVRQQKPELFGLASK